MEKAKPSFLFGTTCMYANDRGKIISYHHTEEKTFLTLRYLAWATWNSLKRTKGTMPYFLKGLPSTQAETLRHSYNSRVVTEKRLKVCRTTESRYMHAIYVLWCF